MEVERPRRQTNYLRKDRRYRWRGDGLVLKGAGGVSSGFLALRGAARGAVLLLTTFKPSANKCVSCVGVMVFPPPTAFPEFLEAVDVRCSCSRAQSSSRPGKIAVSHSCFTALLLRGSRKSVAGHPSHEFMLPFFNRLNSAPCAALFGLGSHPKIVKSDAYTGEKIQRVLYRCGGLELRRAGGGLENNSCRETN